ncbi:uncharacterized protein JCM6883_007538 [Sporobolomyces salmoneus]|uniref:uncharacterized protein n=1 Tax=Sporobolomyces salmoneus TaxID=183962 RepID=UPI0031761B02
MFARGLLVSLLSAIALVTARETLEEAAVHTRELIAYRAYNVGTLISNTPRDAQSPVAGLPFGLQEYYAHYPESNGDLLLLAMPIAAIYRNALPPNPPNLTMTINDMYGFGEGNLAAGRMRVALYGTLERVEGEEEIEKCKQAYLHAHPDARGWIPPGGPHSAFYARFRVNTIYAFDGFGDVSYIGWIPLDLYRESGKKMRSEKEAHKHWPVPRQPEQDDFIDWYSPQPAIDEVVYKPQRLRIQL